MKFKDIRDQKASWSYYQQTLFPLSDESENPLRTSPWECRVVAVGKRRDGGTRYWCLQHKADATAKYGRPAKTCRAAHIPPPGSKDTIEVNIDKYRGGVALWGTVPPVYDTTPLAMERGIHVHARTVLGGTKELDRTVRFVRIFGGGLPDEGILVSELDAIYYMVTAISGYRARHITCSCCGHAHLDQDWFSVHPHRRHLCAGCGRYFRDNETAIGNPICLLRDIYGIEARTPRTSQKKLDIRQADFTGGIQIWGSNPAFIWTSEFTEEKGIHIHAFYEGEVRPKLDETYSRVAIDGVNLDPEKVRILMAQATLPFLKNRILSINCPACGRAQFSVGELAFTPIALHRCKRCSHQFTSPGRLRKTIINPLPAILLQLAQKAPRQPQQHDLNLMPETL